MWTRTRSDKTFRGARYSIEWTFVENQLLEWSHLLESGKKFRVDLAFNYVGAGYQSADISSTKGGKGTRMSATQRMRAERVAQASTVIS